MLLELPPDCRNLNYLVNNLPRVRHNCSKSKVVNVLSYGDGEAQLAMASSFSRFDLVCDLRLNLSHKEHRRGAKSVSLDIFESSSKYILILYIAWTFLPAHYWSECYRSLMVLYYLVRDVPLVTWFHRLPPRIFVEVDFDRHENSTHRRHLREQSGSLHVHSRDKVVLLNA